MSITHTTALSLDVPSPLQPAPPVRPDAPPCDGQAGGQPWAAALARLPADQQRAIILRAVTGTMRASARRAGHPEPMILEAKVKPLPGGGYVLDSGQPMVPLRPEWGGTVGTALATPAPDMTKAKAVADKDQGAAQGPGAINQATDRG